MQTAPDAAVPAHGPPEPARSRDEILFLLHRLSAAWRARHWVEVAACFDPDAVLAAPGFGTRVEGRAAVAETYREFMERVVLAEYEEEAPTVDVWGDTAVATYAWRAAWVAAGTHHREAGHDLLALRRAGPSNAAAGGWRVVWRTILSAPA